MAVQRLRRVRYQPVHPDAYLARLDWRSNLWLFVLAAVFEGGLLYSALTGTHPVVCAVLALLIAFAVGHVTRQIRAGVVLLAVDAPGVYLGRRTASADDDDHGLLAWSVIRSVVLFEIWDHPAGSDGNGQWRRAVGVRLDPDYLRHLHRLRYGDAGAPLRMPQDRHLLESTAPVEAHVDGVSAFRTLSGWRLDRAALEAAVQRFAPGVPVQDGGQHRRREGSLRDLFRHLRRNRSEQ